MRIYEFVSQEHEGRKTYYLFILALNDSDAVYLANNKAKIESIPYVFGESDIVLNEYVGDLDEGCFELIEH